MLLKYTTFIHQRALLTVGATFRFSLLIQSLRSLIAQSLKTFFVPKKSQKRAFEFSSGIKEVLKMLEKKKFLKRNRWTRVIRGTINNHWNCELM
jgi:hypothetical protein